MLDKRNEIQKLFIECTNACPGSQQSIVEEIDHIGDIAHCLLTLGLVGDVINPQLRLSRTLHTRCRSQEQ